MPRYRVQIFESVCYDCEVVARSRAEAEKKAEDLFLEAIKLDAPFSTTVLDRDVVAEVKR